MVCSGQSQGEGLVVMIMVKVRSWNERSSLSLARCSVKSPTENTWLYLYVHVVLNRSSNQHLSYIQTGLRTQVKWIWRCLDPALLNATNCQRVLVYQRKCSAGGDPFLPISLPHSWHFINCRCCSLLSMILVSPAYQNEIRKKNIPGCPSQPVGVINMFVVRGDHVHKHLLKF